MFRKEIKFGDEVTIDIQLTQSKKDFSRWSVRQRIFRNKDIAAVLTLDLAWLNTTERKLAVPPKEASMVVESLPRDENFQWIE